MIVSTSAPTGQNIRTELGTIVGVLYPSEIAVADDADRSKLGQADRIRVRMDEVTGFVRATHLVEAAVFEWGKLHALVGVHGPSAEMFAWADGVNYGLVRTARIEAVKLLCAGDIDGAIVRQLQADAVQFIAARLYKPIASAQDGAAAMQEIIEPALRLYEAGVRYFEVGNEPNLYPNPDTGFPGEGMGVAWHNGKEFADWWISAAHYLHLKMPDAHLGFPAMSPGDAITGVRYDPQKFIREARYAVSAADWLALHVYWVGTDVANALHEVRLFALDHIMKPIMVTEFSNPDPAVSARAKGEQYVRFYAQAKALPPNVGALFSFVLDNAGFPHESWRGTEIPLLVGNRSR